jgi:hypothetical protein
MADTQTESKRARLTPAKAALIAVLAVVLVGVLYAQYGGSSAAADAEPVASMPRRGPGAPAATSILAAKQEKKTQVDIGVPAGTAVVVDETKWKSPNPEDVVDYDPFALPERFPKPRAIERIATGAEEAAAAAADDAKRLADAIVLLRRQLEDLKQLGVQVIVREGDQYVAMIGDRMVHVGEEINGFTVVGIDPTGVRVERKAAQ